MIPTNAVRKFFKGSSLAPIIWKEAEHIVKVVANLFKNVEVISCAMPIKELPRSEG